MKRKVWQRIGSLFDEALKRSGAERDAFLSNLGDEDLEQELRSLLSAHEGRGTFDELADYVSGPEAQRLLRFAPGDQVGSYRIVRELGSGGMATVYEAEDVKHERQVAIKVLHPELAAVLGADRFLQEIRTTARLQHPHVLPLLDSGQADGLLYYVMPYIEGETLRDKLNRETQLGIDEAVRIATQVADALDYAHRQGVIHRDIKPENILLHDGRPLVADFGIAVAVSAAGGERITETGLSLGTPHYMSPEQATAEKELTQRSDIYSLGCVLYEMLTGEPPHTGPSAPQIMKKIATDEARPVTELRKSVPRNVAAATGKSLQKLPADRFESARKFAEALGDPTFTTTAVPVAASVDRSAERWKRIALGLAALAVVATLAAVWGRLKPVARDVDRQIVEFYLDPPDSTMSFGNSLELSPDGQRLVTEVQTDEGQVLYQRTRNDREWRIIPGTEGAEEPFFSPDGEGLGFYSSQEEALKRVPVEGGPAQTVAKVSSRYGSSWGPDNTIVFSAWENRSGVETSALFRVSADGGVPQLLTTPNRAHREWAHISPRHLPGGEVILFTVAHTLGPPVLAALSLETRTVSRLVPGMNPIGDGTDRIIYVTPDRSLVAQAFNPRTMALEGAPTPIAEGVETWGGIIGPHTVSSDGSLAYLSRPSSGDQLLLVSRDGETRPVFSPGVGSWLGFPRFSPSGDQIAFVRGDVGGGPEVWLYSLAEGTARRLSFEGPSADPAWTTDGRAIGYSVASQGELSFSRLYRRAADGTGSAELILAGDVDLWQVDFAPGDSEVVYFARNGSLNTIFQASLGSDSRPVPLMETESFVTDPALSPDGHWLAYKSNESGIEEVYVRSYPDMGPPTIVSIGGGGAPAWSGDGNELFYWVKTRRSMVAASLRHDGPRVTVVERAELFRTALSGEAYSRDYDVHPDGQEFVVVGRPEARIVWRVNALAGER